MARRSRSPQAQVKPPARSGYARRMTVLAGVIAAAAIAYGAYWFSVKESLEARVRGKAERLQAAGFAVRYADLEITGFPTLVRVRVLNLRLSRRRDGVEERLAAKTLSLNRQPWNPGHWIAVAEEVEGAIETEQGALTATALTLKASLVLPGDGDRRLDLVAEPARLGLGGAETQMARLNLNLLWPEDSPPPGADQGLLEAERLRIALRAAQVETVRDSPARATVLAELHGPLDSLSRTAVIAWRDAGGTLEVTEAHWEQGSTQLTMAGSLSLDDRLRPFGALSGTGVDAAQLLRDAAQAGLIPQRSARTAARSLDALSVDGPVDLPLLLQDGSLSLLTVDLAPLPPLY